MPKKLTCEFLLKPGTKFETPCGDPAGTYKVTSAFTIELNLCNKHRDHIIVEHDWTVEKVQDKETVCQQDTKNRNS